MGRPIVFTSTGEKLADFEQFYPDRMADRILGMGDVLTLIEKAEATIDQAQAEEAVNRLQQGRFTLEDFLEQMQQVKKMGPLSGLVGMIPGLPKELRNAEIDDCHDGTHRGHHPFHDPGGAPEPDDHQRLPPASHRQRQRDVDHRGQRPARPLQAGAGLHAPDGGHAGDRRADGPASGLGE